MLWPWLANGRTCCLRGSSRRTQPGRCWIGPGQLLPSEDEPRDSGCAPIWSWATTPVTLGEEPMTFFPGLRDTVRAQRQTAFVGTSAVGQRAQLAAADGDHRIGERLWNGISTVRVNCGTAIVGSPDEVADELSAYWRLGMDEFILSAWPHAEEAERVAAEVLPRLRDRIS